MRQKYQEALSVKVEGFKERVYQWKSHRLRGSELVTALVQDWEDTVKSSIKSRVWQAPKWWGLGDEKDRLLVVAGKINGESIAN